MNIRSTVPHRPTAAAKKAFAPQEKDSGDSTSEPRDKASLRTKFTVGSALVAASGVTGLMMSNNPTVAVLSGLAIIGGTIGATAGLGMVGGQSGGGAFQTRDFGVHAHHNGSSSWRFGNAIVRTDGTLGFHTGAGTVINSDGTVNFRLGR